MPLCHTLPSRRQAMKQDIKNSFPSLFCPFQFIPLLRLLVSSSHFLFITIRFLRCWCLASWSLDPILFLLLLLFFWMKPQLSASYSNIVRGAVVYICITASALALGIYCCLVESVRSLLWFDLYGNQQ